MWTKGQRIVAQTEPELGVGQVLRVDARAVDVEFPAAQVRRRYSAREAPLRRMVLRVGQKAKPLVGKAFIVAEIREESGLVRYTGEGQSVLESELGHELPDQSAVERFLAGPWSPPRAYDLRRAGWDLLSRSLDPDIRGLAGARVSLLPHQLYIAHKVARREWPRVLLSDEVGLGKTIEAGLIFSSLRSLGRAARVLVLAPPALKHQWLSELYRRFNELFAIMDSERQEEDVDFGASQQIISTVDFLISDERWLAEASAEPWDLLIVDEAHHLDWKPGEAGPAWRAVKHLSERAHGLLLLTATPRQQGIETQFGLLHLVDPQRFADFESFKEEAATLRGTAQIARKLHDGDKSEELANEIKKSFANDRDVLDACAHLATQGPERLLSALIDRHGTGRVLMRNRRERLRGFPARRLYSVPLDASETDARLKWFGEFLNALKPGEKVLLLCSSPATARKLDAAIPKLSGLKRALFHEGMDVVERDRQAAWFAVPGGAQLLVSSEIGGEGRNFQFASKLVLWDLPAHPDLLEQRIGRLDRIGQKNEVQIHVPWVKGSLDEIYFRWYSEGLRSFERAWNGSAALFDALRTPLRTCIEAYTSKSPGFEEKLEALVALSRREVERFEALQRESLDVLVDLNSFDEAAGNQLKKRIERADRDPAVRDYMESIFDHYGVEAEDFDEHGTLKLSAHSLTFTESFPELPPGSEVLATFDRAQALAREDLRLLTQDHPMVKGALSLLLDRNEGSASIGRRAGREQATPRMEFLFVLQSQAPAALEVERYLPLTVIEIGTNSKGRASLIDPELDRPLDAVWSPLPEHEQARLAQTLRDFLPSWVDKANALAQEEATRAVADALATANTRLEEEHARLLELHRVNPSVRPEEVEAHRTRITATLEALRNARPRLDALRFVLD